MIACNHIAEGEYDAVFLGTPCETYSALREIQPGPRPLRSAEQLEGLTEGLSDREKKQLKEGNAHTDFSGTVMQICHATMVPFIMENPEPIKEVTIFKMKAILGVASLRGVSHADFDQCCFGCSATKPTRLMGYDVDLSHVNGKRCNHEVKTFHDKEGKEYRAAHERVAQRKVQGPGGQWEYASKSLGNYPAEFCEVIAKALASCRGERPEGAARLLREKLP